MVDSTQYPLAGLWQPVRLDKLFYGPDSVKKHLLSCLPSEGSKAFIITTESVAKNVSLLKHVEGLLGTKHHVGTFADIDSHASIVHLDRAMEEVLKDSSVDTLISFGGGSPIDAAKSISYQIHEKRGKWLYHIAIPTTLSAAECTFIAGYTKADGTKAMFKDASLAPKVIIYDARLACEIPHKLWLASAIRGLDHAVEMMYNPTAAEAPAKSLALDAIANFFTYLPKNKEDPTNDEYITKLQLASFNSLYALGMNVTGGIGLSHTLGNAIGSPYHIPYGITSCITLPGVIRLKAEDAPSAKQISRIVPYLSKESSGEDKKDALTVAEAIEDLVKQLGLASKLKDYDVGEDQVPIITERGTGGQTGGPMYDKVLELVRSLCLEEK